jgi:hypothetical protein
VAELTCLSHVNTFSVLNAQELEQPYEAIPQEKKAQIQQFLNVKLE